MSKKKCLQGMDGMNLEYTLGLEGMEQLYLPVEELKNNANNTIVRIDCVGGKIPRGGTGGERPYLHGGATAAVSGRATGAAGTAGGRAAGECSA